MAQNRKKAPQPPTRSKAGSDKAKKGGKNKGGLWQRTKNAWGAAHDKIDDLKNDRSFMRTWRVLRPVSIRLISLLLVIIIISCVFNTVNSKMFAPVDKNNNEPVMLVVGSGSSMSAVASKLQKMGLINSKWGIKLLADFTNRSGKVKAGEYILDRTMSANEILEILTQPSPVRLTVTVTITEGMNLESIAKLLQEKEVIENAQSFLEQCNDMTAFESFSFVSGLKNRQSVRYQLEGYLFPDTYNFYVGSSNASVINTLLTRFSGVFTPDMQAKAEQMGMSMNEVITLASIVQSEGLTKDFNKISAVFHNRLKADMTLGSDACIQYAINNGGKRKLVLTAEELNVDSPYNTHKNKGLPPGPVCSPGKKAIEAALNPDADIINGKYYYFTLTDPATGESAFSKTYEEHLRIVEKWRKAWEEYDRTH